MTNLELAKKLTELIGGKENAVKTTNCMTRLRITVKDVNKVKQQEIKATEGVMGLVVDGSAIQIVLGPGKVKKVTDICIEQLGHAKSGTVTEDWKDNKDSIKGVQK